MTVLTYRGNEYSQNKEATPKNTVELSYRRSVYNSNRAKAKKLMKISYVYRGIEYQK